MLRGMSDTTGEAITVLFEVIGRRFSEHRLMSGRTRPSEIVVWRVENCMYARRFSAYHREPAALQEKLIACFILPRAQTG